MRAPNSRKAERKRTKSKDSKRTPSTKVQSSKRTPEATATNIRAEEIRKGSDLRRKKSDPTLSPASNKRRKNALHIPPTNDIEGDSPLHSPSTTGKPNLQPVTP